LLGDQGTQLELSVCVCVCSGTMEQEQTGVSMRESLMNTFFF